MIVKAQVSLFSSTGRDSVLVYDQSREFTYESDWSPEVQAMRSVLAGDAKGFFRATIAEDGIFRIDERVGDLDW